MTDESGTPETIDPRVIEVAADELSVYDCVLMEAEVEGVLRAALSVVDDNGVPFIARPWVKRLTAERDHGSEITCCDNANAWSIRAEVAEARVAALTEALRAFVDWGDAPTDDYSDLVTEARAVLGGTDTP